MKKRLDAILSIVCYLLGLFGAIYFGGYLMLLCPIHHLIRAYQSGIMTLQLLLMDVIKIALSTTVAGTVWCIGYIGYNHFIGTEDEYDRLMKQLEEEKEARRQARKEAKAMKQKGNK